MQKSIESIIVNLISHDLGLPDNYGTDSQGNIIPCCVIAAQNVKLFTTPQLQITVKTLSANTYANNRYEETVTSTDDEGNTTETYQERLRINEQRSMQIDMYSRDNSARDRMYEVLACLNSTYSQQLQDLYQFKMGKISNAINLSGLDGSSDINRFAIRFNVLIWNDVTRIIDYYDKFKTNIYDQEGLQAEFEIATEQ